MGPHGPPLMEKGGLWPAEVETFKRMRSVRADKDLHVEGERQRRIGRNIHNNGAVRLLLGGNGEVAVFAERDAGEARTERTGHDQRRLRKALHDSGKLAFGMGHPAHPLDNLCLLYTSDAADE